MITKNKQVLTAQAIRELVEQEDMFILKRLFNLFEQNIVNYKKDKKSHSVVLKVQVEPPRSGSSSPRSARRRSPRVSRPF
jgi:hypothetical protein